MFPGSSLRFLQEPQHLRLMGTALVLGLIVAAEAFWPRRNVPRGRRWSANIGLLLASGLILTLWPLAAVGLAAWAQAHGYGLFNQLHLPAAVEVTASILLLDGVMYWQHRSMHGPAWLWKMHRVHHSDLDFDATTALRFHPLELLATMAWKYAAVLVLGVSPLAALLFEAITGMYSLFIHSNLRLPSAVDRIWRRGLVTPDLHRIHHSSEFDESNRNFGTILSCWDRWFASHREQPRATHEQMQIGLSDFRDVASQSLPALLVQPLRRSQAPLSPRTGSGDRTRT